MYRNEYPRKNFKRKEWKNLNGIWDIFIEEEWKKIEVPFVFQSKLSGIHDNRMCDSVTYKKIIHVPKNWKNKEILLNFGAVDYASKVYVNGYLVGSHIGGNGSFSFPIAEHLKWEENGEELEVRVYDPCQDETIPRGKQYWEENPDSIWYTRTTGIWQTVWIEPVEAQRISSVYFKPDIDKGTVSIELELTENIKNTEIELEILKKEESVFKGCYEVKEKKSFITANLFNEKIFRTSNHHSGWCWSPESPNLFDIKIKVYKDNQIIDSVDSYFGMRKIEAKNGMIYLNNRPYYQKLILDQGYWKDTLMTAKDESDYVKDIEMAKEMGFNGCRKHQKAEDPSFLYHADRLGFLVWSEIGSSASYSKESSQRTINEWSELVKRDYNHPCIVTWVPLNESWGVPNIGSNKQQQAHAMALYYNILSIDDTRLIVANDGWELTKTDICAIHNYDHGGKDELDKQESFRSNLMCLENILNAVPTGREVYAQDYKYEGEPVLLTEFGGLSYSSDKEKGWGYTTIEDEKEFIDTYERLLEDIRASKIIYGYCYTQLSDVEQEVNGLLTFDREYKVNPKEIRRINDRITKIIIKRDL